MIDKKAYRKRHLRWFIGALLFVTIYFWAGKRMVIEIKQLDVHSGDRRTETRGYWGGITIEAGEPWRADDFKKLFPGETDPKWLPIIKSEIRVLPDLSRRARLRRRSNDYGHGTRSSFVRTNLSQVLNAPHLSNSVRRLIIYESFDQEEPNEPSSNFYILDTLRQEVLNAAAFPEAERKEWQERIDRDDGGDITVFLKAAAKYPARDLEP